MHGFDVLPSKAGRCWNAKTKSKARMTNNSADNLLTLPHNAGQAIVEAGAVIACPVLGTDSFVDFCTDRGLAINRERLIRLERIGLFAPLFRVLTPEEDTPPFQIPIRKGNNWFIKKWAWDSTAMCASYIVPDYRDKTQEGYYSIFQVHDLNIVLEEMTRKIELDTFLDCKTDKIAAAWQIKGDRWRQDAEERLGNRRGDEYCRSVPLLCQYISNRYYPQTQSDQRTIRVGGTYHSGHWIELIGHQWNWHEEARRWDPQEAAQMFNLTPDKLRHAYNGLACAQADCDPLENWYQLTQFVSINERKRLKRDALRAETLRAGALMLRLLHKDLYNEELPHPNEVHGTIIVQMPELEVRHDVRRYLEFVVNRFGINPQPKLALIVEGPSEEAAIRKIFDEYSGADPGIYGIEIIVLGGVDFATGGKEDRYRAIFRLIDYLHHHQTFTFLILDNENKAPRLKSAAQKVKSIHSPRRHVTRQEYIRLWNINFEFDNFSCREIAAAMNQLAQGNISFSPAEVIMCKKNKALKKNATPGAELSRLYEEKTKRSLNKIKLNEFLVSGMFAPGSRRKIENRPIIKILDKVARLATHNHFSTRQEDYEINQDSKLFGKKTKQNGKRPKAK